MEVSCHTPNLPTNIVGFRGFDSSIILISRGGIPRPIGDFPESVSRVMLVGTMLVGRLGVLASVFILPTIYLVNLEPYHGNLREQTGENGVPRIPTGSLFCYYRHLRKSPETSWGLRENVIQESCTPVPLFKLAARTNGAGGRPPHETP